MSKQPHVVFCSVLLTVLGVCAQSGDNPGETQPERVPSSRIPPAPVLSPEDQLRTFTVAPGFRVEIVAAEPLISSPVAVQFDPQGRLWAVEMNGYMPNLQGIGESEPTGRIVVLEDVDGDGRMDKRTVFLDRLVMPRSLMLMGAGVLVAEPPRVWHCRDTDGDGHCDSKTLAFDGYATQNDPALGLKSNPEHASNSLLWAMDNWIYSANHTLRYRHDGVAWRSEPTAFRGQWGLSQDNQGRLHYNSNSDQHRADLLPGHYLARNPNLRQPFGINVQMTPDQRTWPIRVNPGVNRGYQAGQLTPEGRLATFTGACGPVVYRGDQFPTNHVGDVFLCEPTANLIRHNLVLDRDGILSSTNAHVQSEFLASTDERFRPVNLANGPDGCLYIVDMARGLIQHHIYVTSYLRRQTESRNLQSPIHLGRIYRVVHAGTPVRRRDVLPAKPTLDEWLQRLSHPNGWWRDCAQQNLVLARQPESIPRLRALCRLESGASALGRIHALWTLEGLGGLDLETVTAALGDPVPRVRGTALRLCEAFLKGNQREEAVQAIYSRAGFVPPEERLQLFLTLGEIGTPAADNILKVLLMNGSGNRLHFDAAISGLRGRELEFLESLVNDPYCATAKPEHAVLIARLARCVIHEGIPARMDRLLGTAATRKPGDWQQLAILDGVLASFPPPGKSGAKPVARALEFEAEPRGLRMLAMAGNAEVQPRVARLTNLMAWPGHVPAGVSVPAVAQPLSAEQQESHTRGKEIYQLICGACHQPHGNGQEGLAPPLRDTEWTTGSEQRLIRIVLHGVRDAITVKGVKYELNMPALMEALDDQQIADVLTYVRREFAPGTKTVSRETVAAVRAATSQREDAWTEPELLRIP